MGYCAMIKISGASVSALRRTDTSTDKSGALIGLHSALLPPLCVFPEAALCRLGAKNTLKKADINSLKSKICVATKSSRLCYARKTRRPRANISYCGCKRP